MRQRPQHAESIQNFPSRPAGRNADVVPSHDFPQGLLAFAEPNDAICDIVFVHDLTGDQ